jgi:hypothetical protein
MSQKCAQLCIGARERTRPIPPLPLGESRVVAWRVLAGPILPDTDAKTTIAVIGETSTGVEALKRAMELMPES